MTTYTLTNAELEDLTRRRRKDAQRKALDAMAIPYWVRHDGTVAVLRSHVERLPGESHKSVPREPKLLP